ncbi:MAG TPA: rhomboid family intramembrane serine protease [Polyangia bacterium]|jgi:rhomboid protease GluP|nr:rhomboid family intramembrane serine protease [Polyangia bacterium]
MNLLRRLPQAPVTLALIIANVVVFGVMVATSHHLPLARGFDNDVLYDAGAAIGEPSWRWITAAFIHVNVLHIVMNMWVLAQIGVLAEAAIGRALFLATYVVTGVTGNILGTVMAMMHHRHVLSAGASGAIMGLFGVATVFAWRTGQRPIASMLAKNVLFVLVIGFVATAGGTIAVDNAAHLGGLVVGALIGLGRARWPRPAPRWAERVLGGGAAAVSVGAFLVIWLGGG